MIPSPCAPARSSFTAERYGDVSPLSERPNGLQRRGERLRQLGAFALLALPLLAAGQVTAQVNAASCGQIWNTGHYGPYDYLTSRGETIGIVERFHFTAKVEHQLQGMTGHPGGDISYTLKAFPNHHRALIAASRLAEKVKKDQPLGMSWPIECYFERAIRFSPYDFVARGLYAQWLTKRQRGDDARAQLEVMQTLAKDNPLSHHNLGLLYFDLGDYEAALSEAHRAMELGSLKSDLAERLKSVGKWRDLQATVEPASGAASGAAENRSK